MFFKKVLLIFLCVFGLSTAYAHDFDKYLASLSPQDLHIAMPDIQTFHPLQQPRTYSPYITVKNFIYNMSHAYRYALLAYQHNMKSKSFFSTPLSNLYRYYANTYMHRAIQALDLSKLSRADKKSQGILDAIMLKEILDRVPVDLSYFPTMAQLMKKNGTEGMSEWLIPHTGIRIAKEKDAPLSGPYYFTPATIANIQHDYDLIKSYPYQKRSTVTPGFYKFFVTTPGGITPPVWDKWMPASLSQLVWGMTIWQWLVLVVVCCYFLITVHYTLLRLFRTTQNKTLKTYTIDVVYFVLASLSLYVLNHILGTYINISGYTFEVIQFILVVTAYVNLAFSVVFIAPLCIAVVIKTARYYKTPIHQELLKGIFICITIVLSVAIIIYGLYYLGVSLLPLLTSIGLVGLAIAFAIKPTLTSIFSSFMILIDKPFVVGDYIEVNDSVAQVKAIGLHSTKVQLLSGEVIVQPNNLLSSTKVINLSERKSFHKTLSIYLSSSNSYSNVEKAINCIQQLIAKDAHPDNAPIYLNTNYIPYVALADLDKDAFVIQVGYAYTPRNIPKERLFRSQLYQNIIQALEDNAILLVKTIHVQLEKDQHKK